LFPLKDNIPTRDFPVLTVAIIVANVLMFFFFQDAELSFGGAGVDDENVVDYGAIPYEITHPGDQCVQSSPTEVACGDGEAVSDAVGRDLPPTWLTLLTSIFMHGGLLHIAGNILFLWIFGNNVEDSMGKVRFAAFYLLGGLAATFSQVLIDADSAIPSIGASGAVAAVLGGYILLYPRARVVTLIFIIFFITVLELPAYVVLGLWFILQLLAGSADLAQPVEGGGVAYFAHIGGFVFGLALIKLFANRVQDDYERPQRLPVY
jgi:membrane associated rhomboid family serine protease